jgi:hypothetical protein
MNWLWITFATLWTYGTLDSRKQSAIWVARWFRGMSGTSNDEIIRTALRARYLRRDMPHIHHLYGSALELVEMGKVTDAQALCHLIAEFELLNHLTPWQRQNLSIKGENVVRRTYRVMDETLVQLGLLEEEYAEPRPAPPPGPAPGTP